jgi:hypothetical protein
MIKVLSMNKLVMISFIIILYACDSSTLKESTDCRESTNICGEGVSCQESNDGTYQCLTIINPDFMIDLNERAGDQTDVDAGQQGGSQAGDRAGYEAGMTAGQIAGTLAGQIAGQIAGQMAGTQAGIEAGQMSGTESGEMNQCLSCEDCRPIQCDCNGEIEIFAGCQNDCCLSQSQVDCEQLCTTVNQCEPFSNRCIGNNPRVIEQCNIDGRWMITPCERDETCQFEQCLPTRCSQGQQYCLNEREILSCINGSWNTPEVCAETCSNNRCTSNACALAANNQSYLGCEYMAKELPNLIHKPNFEEQYFPTGVVLSNISETDNTYVTLYNAQNQAIDLINEVTLLVPDDLMNFSSEDQTIRSEIRDAQGDLVGGFVLRAEQIAIPPGGIGVFLLPRSPWHEGSFIDEDTIRVVTDLPVNAYQFSPYCCNYSFSNDASLLIPTSVRGDSYRVLSIPTLLIRNQQTFENSSSPATVTVIAHEDDTRVSFDFPENAQIEPGLENRLVAVDGRSMILIHKQEAITLRSAAVSPDEFLFEDSAQHDLTGTFIESDKPISVFTGHECMFYPYNLAACDHLEEQLFPIDTWGQNFSLVPIKERGMNINTEKTYWKILAEGAQARITLSENFSTLMASTPGAIGVPYCGDLLEDNGMTIALGEAGFCEFASKKAVDITGNQRLMVMGIMSGQSSVNQFSAFGDRLGDPAIFLVPPSLQFRNTYSFLIPTTYFHDYLTLTFAADTEITLDGMIIDTSTAIEIPGSDKKYMYVELTDGTHKVSADQNFGITVFAFDDFVSYAFTGGLNLMKY